MQVHRHLDAVADGEAEGPDRRSPRTAAATWRARPRSGVGEPEVVGDEHGAGADRARPGRRVRARRAGVGDERRRRRGGAPRAACARARSGSTGAPARRPPTRRSRRGRATASAIVEPARGTNGTTSTTPMRGCTPSWPRRSMRATASAATRRGASSPTRVRTAAVVVGVGVEVEQIARRRRRRGRRGRRGHALRRRSRRTRARRRGSRVPASAVPSPP